MDTTVARCRNCAAELLGRYCAECGQAADVHVPSTLELVHEALEGLTHSDSRVWRTLLLLWFHPGELTRAFIAGKRVAYLPPFRLYLILSVTFFLAAAFSHKTVRVVTLDAYDPGAVSHSSMDSSGASCRSHLEFAGHPEWTQRAQRACVQIARDQGASVLNASIAIMPKAMFIFLPLIAFLHMLMYWRPRHRYAEHLLFFLHLQAFFFSVLIIYEIIALAAERWPALAGAGNLISSLLLWCLPVYSLFAMRRVFQRGWLNTLLKLGALSAAYVMVLVLTVSAVVVYAALGL